MSDAVILEVFAFVYLAVGIGGITDKKMLRSLMWDFEGNRWLTYLSGLFAMVIGAGIVSSRTDSQAASAILVATLWWIALVKGFCIIAFPKWTVAVAEGFAHSKLFQQVFPYVALVLSAGAFAVAGLTLVR